MKIELLLALLTPFISWSLVWLYEYKKVSSSKQTFFMTSARSFTLEYPKDKKDSCTICRSEADFNKWHPSGISTHNSYSYGASTTYDPLLHPALNPPVVSGVINEEMYRTQTIHNQAGQVIGYSGILNHPVPEVSIPQVQISQIPQISISETPSASPDSFSHASPSPVESYSSPSVDSSPSYCDSSVASCPDFSSGGSDPSSSSF